jgi:uncharacterized membrane protein YqjE
MADHIATESPPSMAALLGGIVGDIQTLIRQEITLAKVEIQKEWDKAKSAAGSMMVGAVVLALGTVLLSVAVVCVLHEVAALPWWASFLIVGGVLAAVGAVFLYVGQSKAAQVHLIPPQTAETMKENVQWIRNQT